MWRVINPTSKHCSIHLPPLFERDINHDLDPDHELNLAPEHDSDSDHGHDFALNLDHDLEHDLGLVLDLDIDCGEQLNQLPNIAALIYFHFLSSTLTMTMTLPLPPT